MSCLVVPGGRVEFRDFHFQQSNFRSNLIAPSFSLLVSFTMADRLPNLSFGSDSDDDIVNWIESDDPIATEEPLSEKVMRALWSTAAHSVSFLIFCSIAMFPVVCPVGCKWRITFPGGGKRSNSCFLACTPKRVAVRNDDGSSSLTGVFCGSSKLSWRGNEGSFMHKLGNTVGPQKLTRLILWFSQKCSVKQLATRQASHQLHQHTLASGFALPSSATCSN